MALREREFVLASRSLGAGNVRILFREILPNLVPTMVTVAATGLGILIAAEGALAFLGLGLETSWGFMINAEPCTAREGMVGDDLPVHHAVPHRAVVQPHRRPSGPPLRHPGGSGMSTGSSNNVTQAATRDITGPLLELTDVRTHFRTPRGLVRAVDGVSFTLDRGKSLGIVGESGSGKTILSRSIMGLLPTKGTERSGSIKFAGAEIGDKSRKQMRHVWGKEMAMIFQDPMTSLNPLMKIGDQIAEPLKIHLGMTNADADGHRQAPAARRAHPRARAPPRAVPARDVGRHAPARDDRHRHGLRPHRAVRRRAHHGARRHGAGADPRPARRAAPRPQHVARARHPRPRRGRRSHRRDRRDVRRQAGREGAHPPPVRGDEDALHRGAAGQHPQARSSPATPGSTSSPAARPTSSTRRRVAGSHRAAPTRVTSASRRNPR